MPFSLTILFNALWYSFANKSSWGLFDRRLVKFKINPWIRLQLKIRKNTFAEQIHRDAFVTSKDISIYESSFFVMIMTGLFRLFWILSEFCLNSVWILSEFCLKEIYAFIKASATLLLLLFVILSLLVNSLPRRVGWKPRLWKPRLWKPRLWKPRFNVKKIEKKLNYPNRWITAGYKLISTRCLVALVKSFI